MKKLLIIISILLFPSMVNAASNCDNYKIYRMGDLNMDGIIDATDLSYFEQLMNLGSTYFSTNQKSLADVDFDGRLAAADKSYFIQYYLNDYATKLFFKGDLNQDGKVDTTDIGLFDFSTSDKVIQILGDVNLDGEFNNTDKEYLEYYVTNCSSSSSESSDSSSSTTTTNTDTNATTNTSNTKKEEIDNPETGILLNISYVVLIAFFGYLVYIIHKKRKIYKL